MSTTEKLQQLLEQFLIQTEDTIGVVVSNHDGLLLHSQVTTENIDGDLLASMSSLIEPAFNEIKESFSKNRFGSAVFETDEYRLLNVSVGEWIYIFILDNLASLDKVYPYAYLASEKMQRILEGRNNVQLTIPRLGNLVGVSLQPPANSDHSRWAFKFILLGESGVGKTSLVYRFVENKFDSDFRATIGLNVMSHPFNFLGYNINMNIYDIGSQKFFKRVRRTYYQGANAGLIVFDLHDRDSFRAVETWKKELDKFSGDVEPIPFCLVGNKSDLNKEVSFQEGSLLAEKLGGSYIETSALKSSNVEDAFALICYRIISEFLDKSKEI